MFWSACDGWGFPLFVCDWQRRFRSHNHDQCSISNRNCTDSSSGSLALRHGFSGSAQRGKDEDYYWSRSAVEERPVTLDVCVCVLCAVCVLWSTAEAVWDGLLSRLSVDITLTNKNTSLSLQPHFMLWTPSLPRGQNISLTLPLSYEKVIS